MSANKVQWVVFFVFMNLFPVVYGRFPTTRLCGDLKCETIISLAKTTLHFNPADPKMISFKGNLPCRVMSKSIGEHSDLWEIEVQGRRGFAPKKMLMEQKILIKAIDLIQIEDEPIVEEPTIDLDISKEELSLTDAKADADVVNQSNVLDNSVDNEEQNVPSLTESPPSLIANEPLAIKKDMYITGDKTANKVELNENENVRLEIVGLENNDNDISTKNISDIESNSRTDSIMNSDVINLNKLSDDQVINVSDDITEETNTTDHQIHDENTDTDKKYDEHKINNNDDTADKEDIENQNYNNEDTADEQDTKILLDQVENEELFITKDISNQNQYEEVTTTAAAAAADDDDDDNDDNGNGNDAAINQTNNIRSTIETFNETENISESKMYEQIDKQQEFEKDESVSNIVGHKIENIDIQGDSFIRPDTKIELVEDESSQTIVGIDESSNNRNIIIDESELSLQKSETIENSDKIMHPYLDVEQQPGDEITIESENDWLNDMYSSFENAFNSMRQFINFKSSIITGETNNRMPNENGYCEKLNGNCPEQTEQQKFISSHSKYADDLSHEIHYTKYLNDFLAKVVAMADLVILLALTASAILIFIFFHYCLTNHHKEIALLSKLNTLERKHLLTQKECSLAKAELNEIKIKMNNIANKSFGADDMVKQHEKEKNELSEQIGALEKELEAAAEAGLELNKMVSELLSNQSGSDSIINSVEELQHQLQEQQQATIYINNLMGEKSRENSELQVLLADTNKRFGAEIQDLLNENSNLKSDKEATETKLNEFQEKIISLETRINEDNEDKLNEMSHLKMEYNEMEKKYEDTYSKWQISAARADALKDAIEKLEGLNGVGDIDIKTIIEIAGANAKYLVAIKENEMLRDHLEAEIESNKHSKIQLAESGSELNRLREQLNQSEKTRLEAQTRLDVLSSYFKEKESQLQKELNVKEALFMKQQGESTSTVERIRNLQEDMQRFRSQNDQLRAEIDAQSAAHKAQINAAEIRAHDSWLACKQAERRLDEARSEASILRKKLTSLTLENNFSNNGLTSTEHMSAPSPIHLESPSSPMNMNINLPPPPLIPFMPPPPLPLLPLTNDMQMRPPPLGRLMSPSPLDPRYDNKYEHDEYPMTETDFSPPRSPDLYRYSRGYSPEPESINKPPSHTRKGILFDSDDWDRQTF